MAKILIVDDEEGIRMLYSMELQDEGYEVITLPDGKDLVAVVDKEMPDCIVLDIKMREYNGLDLLQQIRKRHYDLPVILNSAYSSFKVDSPKEATVVGTKGFIRIHAPFYCPSAFTLYLNGQGPQTFEFPYEGNGWNYEAVEVMDCLRAGKLESDLVPHAESLALMRTMDRFRAQIGLKYPVEK